MLCVLLKLVQFLIKFCPFSVTCQRQPALGCVYKLVDINGKPKIKLSQDVEKVTMPGKKMAYRLYSNDGHALIDLLLRPDESPPEVNKRVLCRHPFQVRIFVSLKNVFLRVF